MSKSTLSILKSEIQSEQNFSNNVKSDFENLEQKLLSAMNDRVGVRARQSIGDIARAFSFSADKGYQGAMQSTCVLVRGYDQTDEFTRKAESLLLQAKAIVKGIGDL